MERRASVKSPGPLITHPHYTAPLPLTPLSVLGSDSPTAHPDDCWVAGALSPALAYIPSSKQPRGTPAITLGSQGRHSDAQPTSNLFSLKFALDRLLPPDLQGLTVVAWWAKILPLWLCTLPA